jgi:glucose-1-phosphate thymidylyltransferase
MKAVVLAGGYATRMWPITRNRPKMLLPLGDVTVIDVIFDDLEADDRIDEVFVSTNEAFAEEFEEYIADSEYEKPTLSVEETTGEEEKFGVVGALAQLIDREDVEDDLLIVAGDNLLPFDMAEFVDYFEKQGTASLAAYDVGSREKAKSYGLVELDDDERVVDFQEKPEDPKSTLVSIGCYAFPSETLPKFDDYLADDNNPDEPGWFVQWLQNEEPVHAFSFDGAWYDIGTPASYLEAVAWQLGGENLVSDSATVENSELGENVHLMDGASVRDSSLDDTVVFPEADIENCDIRESVIDRETRVQGLDLSGALIGAHSRIVDEADGL